MIGSRNPANFGAPRDLPGGAPRSEDARALRVLVIHPDAQVRAAIESSLRRIAPGPLSIYDCPGPLAAFERMPRLDPHVVLLDLGAERDLALELARAGRRAGRRIVALFSPLEAKEGDGDLFRGAARAGCGDFVALPAAEDELAAALEGEWGGTLEGGVRGLDGPSGSRRPMEGRLVAFVGHKGGVGTSTLAANAALALAASGRIGRGVVLCDAACTFGSGAALLGVKPEADLGDLATDLGQLGRLDRLESLASYLAYDDRSGLALLAAPRDPRAAAGVAPEDLGAALVALRRRFGLVIVDTPSALDLWSLAVLDLAESIVLVTEAVAPTVVASAVWLDLLAEEGFARDRFRVVLNRQGSGPGLLSERTVSEHLGRPIDAVLPEAEAVRAAGATGSPMVLAQPKAPFSVGVQRLVDLLLAGRAEMAVPEARGAR